MLWQIPMMNEAVLESKRAQASADKAATLFARAATAVFAGYNERVLREFHPKGVLDAPSHDQTE